MKTPTNTAKILIERAPAVYGGNLFMSTLIAARASEPLKGLKGSVAAAEVSARREAAARGLHVTVVIRPR
jgi:hypothetical protein